MATKMIATIIVTLTMTIDNGDMLSPKRYVLIALHFMLKQWKGALKDS